MLLPNYSHVLGLIGLGLAAYLSAKHPEWLSPGYQRNIRYNRRVGGPYMRRAKTREKLVVAIACCLLLGCSGTDAILLVKERRKGADALTNEAFNRFLMKIPAKNPLGHHHG